MTASVSACFTSSRSFMLEGMSVIGMTPSRFMLPSIWSRVLSKKPSASSVGIGGGGLTGAVFFLSAATAPALSARQKAASSAGSLLMFRTEFLDESADDGRVDGIRRQRQVFLESACRTGGIALVAVQVAEFLVVLDRRARR